MLAFGTTAVAEASASLANYWTIRHACRPRAGVHVTATSVKEALASGSWKELLLLSNVTWIQFVLAPCLNIRRYALVMTLGRVPTQVAHVWAGCALRDAGEILAKGDIEAAASGHPVMTAVGVILIISSVLGLVMVAKRAKAAYSRLCECREPGEGP